MGRALALSVVITLGVAVQAQAQDWAKMFDNPKHNFGAVAKDAKTEHRFVFTNTTDSEVHISGVRTSCGCTTPIVVNDTLKPGESTEIIAHFNTDRFKGQRGATLTVNFDRPNRGQAQLRVDGFIMSDVVIEPGIADFGTFHQGAATNEKQIVVLNSSRRDLGVVSTKTSSPYVEAEVVPQASKNGQQYIVKVRLKDAPAGYLADTVYLMNAEGKSVVNVPVEGRGVASITASPTNLYLGEVRKGQKISKQLVVNGKQPFRILSVHCDDPNFAFHVSDDSKTVHVIQVDFTAQQPGKVKQKICIETDMGNHVVAELSAFADVLELAGTP